MRETEHFDNDGRGWQCKSCRAADAEAVRRTTAGPLSSAPLPLPRFFREGEAEERDARLSSPALARWRDTPRGRALRCPRCGAEEVLSTE